MVSKNKTILITGGSGLLATNWAGEIKNNHSVILLLHNKNISLDGIKTIKLANISSANISKIITDNNIDIIINTIGLTSVERCQKNPLLAKNTNAKTAKNIAIACAKSNTKLVHISTDHLFDGSKKLATEKDNPKPINIYAQTKLDSEKAILKYKPNSLIIRTNFFGYGTDYRQSFSDIIISTLKNNNELELFNDVFYTPILIAELVKSVHQLIEQKASGIFNIVSSERISKYEFGLKVAKIFNLNTKLIKSISINDKKSLITRPKDMSLSNKKLIAKLKKPIPSIDKQIKILKIQQSNHIQTKLNIIPYGKHYIDNDDINAVIKVLKSRFLTQGPKINEFENKIAKYVDAKYALALSSGTAALHLAALVLGLGKGDSVITSPNTFVATSNAILYVGATPVFVDIDNKTLNIDLSALEQVIINNPKVKAIFPVHFAGLACDMAVIKQLADKYKLFIIEDAAHALGATYKDNSKVGNCKYSDMTIFSFHPVKGIAAGEGGAITTNNKQIYSKLFMLRSHGITKGNFEFPGISVADNTLMNKKEALENSKLKRWYYEMQQLGFNYRITDIQCALAISQMNKIDKFLSRRKEIVKRYDKAFNKSSIITLNQKKYRNYSSHHIYTISIDFKRLKITRNRLMTKLVAEGIGSQVHYIPVVSQPYYQNLGYNIANYPITKKYYNNALSIPLYYSLTNDEQDYIIKILLDIIDENKITK